MKHVAFICTGNTCRSPMAEAMLRHMAKKENRPIEVRSAGVTATMNVPASVNSLAILRGKGIHDLLKSSPVDASLIEWADLILTMTVPHKRNVIQKFPQSVDKVHTLQEFVEDDPKVLANIREVEQLYSEWELKKALAGTITEEDRKRLIQLEQSLPDYDISDPFGGSLVVYRKSAEEIETALRKLIKKL